LIILKDKRKRKRKRRRKKHFNKIEKRKEDLVNNLHWDFINHLLKNNDVVYYGDIKSHDIVKNGKNKVLNQAFNDLKFYQLKQRLLYKAYIYGKKVIVVPEQYTTKTCSCCGWKQRSLYLWS
jgi:putative transposase